MTKKLFILITIIAFVTIFVPINKADASHQDLEINCTVGDRSIDEGDRTRFEVEISGGDVPYDIDWDFGDGDSSSDRIVNHRYDDAGNYRAKVTVEDDRGDRITDTCPTVNVDKKKNSNNNGNDNLKIECIVDDTTINKGDYVTYKVNIDGGRSPFRIDWNGSITGNDKTERVRFNSEGKYKTSVTVRDNRNNKATESCPDVYVGKTSNNNVTVVSSNNHSNNSTAQTGQLASLSSVFLSQVPYTGPEDVLMILGIIALVLVWSIGVGTWLRKQRFIKSASRKIEDFKEKNRLAKKIS